MFAGGVLGVYLYFHPPISVTQYENGLAIYRGGALTAVVLWENVTEFYQTITHNQSKGGATSTTYVYTLKMTDGRSFNFDADLRECNMLSERIQQAVMPLLAAHAQATFNAGQPMRFGELTISQARLDYKSSSIPWTEFSGVRVSDGRIELQTQGRWFNWASLYVGDAPNALALVYLLNQILAAKSRS